MKTKDDPSRYSMRGVSASKREVRRVVDILSKGLFPSAFCRVFPDLLGGASDFCTVLHADDVGTKTALAYIAWREGGGSQIWQDIAQDSLVMNLNDLACVGSTGPFYVLNTIARDAKLITQEVLEQIILGYKRQADMLESLGITCELVGGETSDCGDVVRTIFVESAVATRLPKSQIIDAGNITHGDVIVSFASYGQALWEDKPCSGIGSNGLTSARHDTLLHKYAELYPETFTSYMDAELAYCGPYSLSDALPRDSRFTIGSALLSPTRNFLPLLTRMFTSFDIRHIHGLIHCTGGGQTKILNFGRDRQKSGNRYVKHSLLPVPPVFQMLQEVGDFSWYEMYRVFNMGQQLEAVVNEEIAAACVRLAADCNIDAVVSGHVDKAETALNEVLISNQHGEQHYVAVS